MDLDVVVVVVVRAESPVFRPFCNPGFSDSFFTPADDETTGVEVSAVVEGVVVEDMVEGKEFPSLASSVAVGSSLSYTQIASTPPFRQCEQDGCNLSHFVFLTRQRAQGLYVPGRRLPTPLGSLFERAEDEVGGAWLLLLLLLPLLVMLAAGETLAFTAADPDPTRSLARVLRVVPDCLLHR